MHRPFQKSYARALSFEQPAEATHTLRQTFDELVLPELISKRRRNDTISEYRTHLRRWDEYWKSRKTKGNQNHRINDPVIGTVSRRDLLEWRTHLAETLEPGGPRTLNKHLGTVHAVLATAVKHGWLWSAPKLDPLPCRRAAPKRYLTYEQIAALYEACGEATWPPRRSVRSERKRQPPAVEWRAALVLFFNYGFRTQELISYERGMRTLTWGQVSFEAETPAEAGHARCEAGWLWYVPQKQERDKDEVLVLPLNAVVRAHLESLKPSGTLDPQRPIFDWPLNPVALYEQWRKLLEISEVRPKPNLKTGEQEAYHLKNLRKTCTTWHNAHCPGISIFVTGHADDRDLDAADRALQRSSRVSQTHYENGENLLVAHLRDFPQPEPFRRILDR